MHILGFADDPVIIGRRHADVGYTYTNLQRETGLNEKLYRKPQKTPGIHRFNQFKKMNRRITRTGVSLEPAKPALIWLNRVKRH